MMATWMALGCCRRVWPSLIFKRCWMRGLVGSSLVMGAGARCAFLQSVFTETPFFHVHAEADTVLRISGCHFLSTMVCGMLGLTGTQSEATVAAVHAANVVAQSSELLESQHGVVLPTGTRATRLLA